MPEIEVRELRPELLEDYLGFFDDKTSSDFPWWSGCYCAFFHHPSLDEEWDPTPDGAAEHRAYKAGLIRNQEAHGLLAYAEGKVVGWCNAAPRASFQNLRRNAQAVEDPEEPVGSIVCFKVSPAHRGSGIARILLDGALELFRGQALGVAEAYPSTAPPSGPYADQIPASAWNYHGRLDMYLKAGFQVHREFDRFAVVHKPLGD